MKNVEEDIRFRLKYYLKDYLNKKRVLKNTFRTLFDLIQSKWLICSVKIIDNFFYKKRQISIFRKYFPIFQTKSTVKS